MTALSMSSVRDLGRIGLGAPILLVVMLSMMMVPLPPMALDMLFTFNIALGLIVLLAALYAQRPLDFASFPTVLLVATLFRLALNVASTRVVLLRGHGGTDAAGHVIESFGEFVVGGSYTVGFVVFVILVIINFVVVTKGAGRISEVNARFTLDAMPGKQMAIDADLNAGVLSQEEARRRREEVAQEADFYGAMDGAGKFVRGDAIAGILILVVNILGGLAIGTLQHGLPFSEAARVYSLLTIGDGLVAQVPSLVLSTAAAIMVTRVSSAQDMGREILSQLFDNPKALMMTAGIVGLIGVLPGMPNVAFLSLAGLAGAMGWVLHQRRRRSARPSVSEPAGSTPTSPDVSWDDVTPIDPLGLEVGYRLIPLVDNSQGGQLIARIKGVRRKLSKELGFLIPAVHIRDNLELSPSAYRLTLMGAALGEGEVESDRELAINPGQVYGSVPGRTTRDPVFDLEAVWLESHHRDQAQSLGYTVVDASTVIATHLSQIIQKHAHELLGHDEAQQLLDRLVETAPKLVEDLVPKTLSLGVVARVLQQLLEERVPIRDMRTIAETLAEHAPVTQDATALTGEVRKSLGRSIAQQISGPSPELAVMTLHPELERILLTAARGAGDGASIEPGMADSLRQSLVEAVRQQEIAGNPAVLLVSDGLRPTLAKLARHASSALNVLAYGEVPDERQLKVVATIGGNERALSGTTSG